MANASVSHIGQINGGGDLDALWLKVFAGEVLTAFEEHNVFLPLTRVRTISSGKSAQFPASGKIAASEYHTPGNEIVGQAVLHAEKVITIDDLLISHAFLSNIEEAKNHYDVRSVYSTQIGRELAKSMDVNIARCIVKAARQSAIVTGENGGTVLTNASAATDGEVLASLLFQVAQTFDEKDIPNADRYFACKPAVYNLLAQTTKVLNKDWGGSGSYSDGKVLKVADITIVKSNHVPSTNVNTGPTKYQGNFTTTVGVAFTPDAAGTVKLLDLSMESEYDIRRQGTLMVGKYAVGHDWLRPDCAVEIRTAAP